MKTNYTVQEVAEMLKGEHSSQKKKQFSMFPTDSERKKINEQQIVRSVGEKWEELDENGEVLYIWTQHDGYRTKEKPGMENFVHPSWDEFNYPNCEETCEKRNSKAAMRYTRLDKRYRKIYGMCTDCAAKFETKLKMTGKWEEFERNRMLANAQSFFNEADDAVKEVAGRLESVEFLNETGRLEKWDGDPEKAKLLLEEYNMYKNLILETLEGKRDDTNVI